MRNLWLYFTPSESISISPLVPTDNMITLSAGPLWHTITRVIQEKNLEVTVTNFVPENETAEIMLFSLTNQGSKTQTFTPTIAFPLFCRSADNLRDHRHVTSLLQRIKLTRYGIIVTPTMSFDERGHKKNNHSYFVLSHTHSGLPTGFFPTLEQFTGTGTIFFPDAVYKNLPPCASERTTIQGKEPFAGIRFKEKKLKPKETITFYTVAGVTEQNPEVIFSRYASAKKISVAFENSKRAWKEYLGKIVVTTANPRFNLWFNWVQLQPYLRKLFGCSFLPHFDYGKGGRGWRDLWQDALALLLREPKMVKPLIANSFRGVRIDGSNATVITRQDDFIADRNNISRVWSDHGVWPYLTIRLYLDQTGDFNILLDETTYFRDHLLKRSREVDPDRNNSLTLKTQKETPYQGTILEHILIQTLVQFYNVGIHNSTRLENADWNDGLDMASEHGETVAFSSMYAHNLGDIAKLLTVLCEKSKIRTVYLLEELLLLLDTLQKPLNYDSYQEKTLRLEEYFEATKRCVSGNKIAFPIEKLVSDLQKKSLWFTQHLRTQEWLPQEGIFNGYYDNQTQRVEGKKKGKIQMSLTGQVFPVLGKIATTDQIRKILEQARKVLQEPTGLYRLNTNFKNAPPVLGRAFGFSYGDKENGSVFSHMNIMFAYGLYRAGFAKEANQILLGLFETSLKATMYPQLPEYFNLQGQGLYFYLTGSASWYVYTLITEVFGIRGDFGNLVLAPKLSKEYFKMQKDLTIALPFQNKPFRITYYNPERKSWPDYKIVSALLNGESLLVGPQEQSLVLGKKILEELPEKRINSLNLTLR